MRFYLGTHRPEWLAREDLAVPLFVSRKQLARRVPTARNPRRRLPVAVARWALDSGGFTELSRAPHRWTITPDEYVDFVAQVAADVGRLDWAAPMDSMCEPAILEATGRTVAFHQRATVENFLELRGRGPFVPVLQGWTEADYHRCVELYDVAGVDLRAEPLVGLGTVCRRQATPEVARIVRALSGYGLRLHGFGMKSSGLARCADMLDSADSMAWSARGRAAWHFDRERLCGGDHPGGCANCAAWALLWRQRAIDGAGLFAVN